MGAEAQRRPGVAHGPVTPQGFAQSLAALMPERAIIVDESVSFGRGLFPITAQGPAHDWLSLTGGAIGDGIPMAVGAAVAAPDRRVIALQADGSAMYTIAGLWSAARMALDIVFVVLANRKYAILLHELASVGANPGRTALDMLDLGRPDLDFVKIAEGMGVRAAAATDLDTFNTLLQASISRSGPSLIELQIG